jgi:hypothetical protein
VSELAKAVALLCVMTLAAWPGLAGGFVYDDTGMVDNPAYDSIEDVLRVPFQDSNAYIRSADATGAGDRAFRPTTMLTLVLTHALWPQPWLHHLIGLLLHALLCVGLHRALRPAGERAASFLTAAFALHPVGVESWVWIHGRSDLVAGLFLVLLARLFTGRVHALRASLSAGLIGLLGAGAKETFLPAAVALVTAQLVARRGAAERSVRWVAGSALVGVVALWLVRGLLVPTRSTVASGTSVLQDLALVNVLAKEILLACDHVLFLRGEPMLALASLAVRAPTATEIAAGLGLLGLMVVLVRARDVRGIVLVLGAGATLAPTVLVSRGLWFGFDRYLYMPMILVMLALAPYLQRAIERLSARDALVRALGFTWLAASALVTWTASAAYASNATFHRALMVEYPDDPSVMAYEALNFSVRGQLEFARGVLEHFPSPPWPEAVLIPLVIAGSATGDELVVDRALAYGEQHFPRNPLLRAHAMVRHYQRGRDAAALRLAHTFEPGDATCAEVARQVAIWAAAPGPRRAVWQEAAGRMRCRAGGK